MIVCTHNRSDYLLFPPEIKDSLPFKADNMASRIDFIGSSVKILCCSQFRSCDVSFGRLQLFSLYMHAVSCVWQITQLLPPKWIITSSRLGGSKDVNPLVESVWASEKNLLLTVSLLSENLGLLDLSHSLVTSFSRTFTSGGEWKGVLNLLSGGGGESTAYLKFHHNHQWSDVSKDAQ